MNPLDRLQEAMDALEREAAEGVANFDAAADAIGKVLELKVMALVHAQDIYYQPGNEASPQAPMIEQEHKAMNGAVAGILEQARALAFAKALLIGLRDREAAVRAEAFPA